MRQRLLKGRGIDCPKNAQEHALTDLTNYLLVKHSRHPPKNYELLSAGFRERLGSHPPIRRPAGQQFAEGIPQPASSWADSAAASEGS